MAAWLRKRPPEGLPGPRRVQEGPLAQDCPYNEHPTPTTTALNQDMTGPSPAVRASCAAAAVACVAEGFGRLGKAYGHLFLLANSCTPWRCYGSKSRYVVSERHLHPRHGS